MSKPVLGRGLGSLLNGSGPQPGPPRVSLPSADSPISPTVDHGLRTLIRGHQTDTSLKAAAAPGDLSKPAKLRIPAWYFFALDLLLLLFVGLMVVTNAPLDAPRIILSAAAVSLGALLSTMAIWSNSRTAPEKPASSPPSEWVVARSTNGHGDREVKRFVVHLQRPVFVGEVIEDQSGNPAVKPLWTEGEAALSETLVGQIKRELEGMR